MLYDVKLRVDYSYGGGSEGGRTLLRLQPSDLPGQQRVESASLMVEPAPDARAPRTDFFGNTVTELAFHGPLTALSVALSARLERRVAAEALDLSPNLVGLRVELGALRDLSPDSPHHFTGPSPRIRPSDEIAAYAREVSAGARSVRDVVSALGQALHRDMAFDPGATDVATPPEAAFAARHGVCQDFAQVMIAGLRGLGIPSGYVSGVIRTEPPPGQPRLEGADAMHAWVRAWCGSELGWVEFDPTNDCFAGIDHLTIARGRDYADIAPVRGWLRTSGGQMSRQSVDVIPVS